MKKVCMFVTNTVVSDPRVKREAATLVRAGYAVVVIGVGRAQDAADEWHDGYRIRRVVAPELFTVRQALVEGLKRMSPTLHDGLRAAYRTVRYGTPHPVVVPPQPASAPKAGGDAPSAAKPTFWQQLNIDQLAIRCIVWINIAMARLAEEERADLYHAHDLDTLLAGYLAKRRTGKPLFYDFHELYTEQFPAGVRSPIWKLWYSLLERVLVGRADRLLTVCDSLGEWVAGRYGVRQAQTVMNVPEAQPLPEIRVQAAREPVILFHGGYLPERGLEGLVDCARYLRRGRIVFRGFGSLEPQLRARVKDQGVEAVVSFAPPVPMMELVRAASDADIGVIPYLPVCLNNRFCLPNKIFEYMMAGLAVVGSDLPELRRIIVGNDVGRVYNPMDSQDLARVLNELTEYPVRLLQIRKNALRAAQGMYNWGLEGQKLLSLYSEALGTPAEPCRQEVA